MSTIRPGTEPAPRDVAAHFGCYLDLWVRDEVLGFEAYFSARHRVWTGSAARFPSAHALTKPIVNATEKGAKRSNVSVPFL